MNSRNQELDVVFGVERESHRMTPEGEISRLAQPSLLAPPSFTKDFSESQLEIVTRPHDSISSLITEMKRLTRQAQMAIRPEVLWPFSMPPRLPPESEIEIARLRDGWEARVGELYRRGLALRYGKARQMICGLHLNVSIGSILALFLRNAHPLQTRESEARTMDALYLRLARNLYDDLPHLILITGASPLPGGLFLGEYPLGAHPAAVSYRNSIYGYARGEYRPFLDLRSIERYTAGVRRGLQTESDRFQAHGLVRDGFPLQLNTRVFQKEKEFYAPIRFKRTARNGEYGLRALERDGVEYIELRFLDVDPFSPLGISEETIRLLHLFILDGLMRPSGPGTTEELGRSLDEAEDAALAHPTNRWGPGSAERFRSAQTRLESLRTLARRLDSGSGNTDQLPIYEMALEEAIAKTKNPGRLPAARLLAAFEAAGKDWTEFGMEMAARYVETTEKGTENELAYSRI
jgi:glutamate--cysteine ligase